MPFAPETGKNIKFRLSTALMTAAELIAVIPRPAEVLALVAGSSDTQI
jgi:hypothetical protein